MSEMVERIELILAKMHEEQSLSIKSEDNRNYLRAHIKVARAVIKAMREPTEEMIIAGKREADAVESEYKDAGMLTVDVHRPYQAMIDAALK